MDLKVACCGIEVENRLTQFLSQRVDVGQGEREKKEGGGGSYVTRGV